MGKGKEKSKKIFKIKKFKPGDSFYTLDGYLNHIIDIVEDKEFEPTVKVVVYKCWLKYKGRWGFYAKDLGNMLFEQCLMNDLPVKKRIELYNINEEDPNGWV